MFSAVGLGQNKILDPCVLAKNLVIEASRGQSLTENVRLIPVELAGI